jgi:hypothetical protein
MEITATRANTSTMLRVDSVKFDGVDGLFLYRGTSERLLKNGNPYLDHKIPISFTTDRRVAKRYATLRASVLIDPIVMQIFVPIRDIDFNWARLPRFSPWFTYGSSDSDKEFSTIWQVPKAWMSGYWNLKTNEHVINKGFGPASAAEKTPLSALSVFIGMYRKDRSMSQELDELRKSLPNIDKWLVEEGFQKYLQLEEFYLRVMRS